jgi:hypothetical protein
MLLALLARVEKLRRYAWILVAAPPAALLIATRVNAAREIAREIRDTPNDRGASHRRP